MNVEIHIRHSVFHFPLICFNIMRIESWKLGYVQFPVQVRIFNSKKLVRFAKSTRIVWRFGLATGLKIRRFRLQNAIWKYSGQIVLLSGTIIIVVKRSPTSQCYCGNVTVHWSILELNKHVVRSWRRTCSIRCKTNQSLNSSTEM